RRADGDVDGRDRGDGTRLSGRRRADAGEGLRGAGHAAVRQRRRRGARGRRRRRGSHADPPPAPRRSRGARQAGRARARLCRELRAPGRRRPRRAARGARHRARRRRRALTVPAGAFTVAGRTIAPGQPVFVIAEAGVNHNGDPAMAKALIDAAADAGADAVKFQTFRTAALTSRTAPKAAYQLETTGAGESQSQMLERLELSVDTLRALQAHAAARRIVFFSTPFDEASADTLGVLRDRVF